MPPVLASMYSLGTPHKSCTCSSRASSAKSCNVADSKQKQACLRTNSPSAVAIPPPPPPKRWNRHKLLSPGRVGIIICHHQSNSHNMSSTAAAAKVCTSVSSRGDKLLRHRDSVGYHCYGYYMCTDPSALACLSTADMVGLFGPRRRNVVLFPLD